MVITLRPEAASSGLNYEKVVSLAKGKIDLASMGIPFLDYKETATGSRKVEIPGSASGEKADFLAEKLHEIFFESVGEGKVDITRPVKCAELRITGLDDATSSEEVATAVADKGGCPLGAVKVGAVRRMPYGIRATWVRCPVTAAKRVIQDRRIMLGWVGAKVTLLQPPALRCFRCLDIGHIRRHCKSAVDRSSLCFRCGTEGHKASDCTLPPHCPLCTSAGKQPEHRLGSSACIAPSKPAPDIKRGGTRSR